MHLPPGLIHTLCHLCAQQLKPSHFRPLSGGSINQVYRVESGTGQPLILKLNTAAHFPQLFERERNGLELLRPHIRVPEVIGQGSHNGVQFLLLECIEESARTPAFWKAFGQALAGLHSVSEKRFGLHQHNYMGAVPQDNTPAESWSDFFANRRLRPLARRCADKGLLGTKELEQLERLCTRLHQLFSNSAPVLLHGDLWSGNFLCGNGGLPVLIDPAVYYGHAAADLGMTTLFGGFAPLFYEAYHYHRPLPAAHKNEWELCNLYPLLIHLLLFGAGYLGGIQRTLQRFAGTQRQN